MNMTLRWISHDIIEDDEVVVRYSISQLEQLSKNVKEQEVPKEDNQPKE